MLCRHCFVSGRVQGVFFRASTCEQAQRLGLRGWVCNLSDGRVEVLAGGPDAAVLELCEWLRHGPPMARVSEVRIDAVLVADCEGILPPGFEVR